LLATGRRMRKESSASCDEVYRSSRVVGGPGSALRGLVRVDRVAVVGGMNTGGSVELGLRRRAIAIV
jgi:hypothetical protein